MDMPMTTSFGLCWRAVFGKGIEIDFELVHVEWDIENLQAACPGGSIIAIAGMSAEWLRRRHDHIARLGQRMIDRHIAEHAAHQAMIRVIATERNLQQFDAQRFDFIDVLGARKPAIDTTDISFRCARVPISEDSKARTIGLVGASGASKLIHRSPRHSSFRLTASMTACAHILGDSVRAHNGPGICKHFPIMDFKLVDFASLSFGLLLFILNPLMPIYHQNRQSGYPGDL